MDPSRYACTVLEAARAAVKNMNHLTLPMAKRHLSTIIEEMQTVVSRMEAGLEDKNDYARVRANLKDAKADLKKVRADLRKAKKELKAIDADIDYYTEVRAKILEEILRMERFHALPVEILGKEGLQ